MVGAIAGLAFVLASHLACADEAPPDLVIYAYDSFTAEGGLGPDILPLFEKECRCRVVVLASGDGGQLVTRLELDARAGQPRAQLVIGLDGPAFERARPWIETWGDWRPSAWKEIPDHVGHAPGLLPFDYGAFAWMMDEKELAARKLESPHHLQDLLSPVYRRMLLLEDPRTSTPGMAFLLFTSQILRDRVWDFWKAFRPQMLTLPTGWAAAYGLFLRGEAPLVWSFTTSQAYHMEHHEDARYRALVLDDGTPVQVEGAAIIKGSLRSERTTKLARQFLEFMISPEVQRRIPLKQWMYPAIAKTPLPASFALLPQPKKWVSLDLAANRTSELLKSWGRVMLELEP
jgi:thiamine transport system substrate-binding protein